jgi:hypothetical protein
METGSSMVQKYRICLTYAIGIIVIVESYTKTYHGKAMINAPPGGNDCVFAFTEMDY